MAWYKSGGKAGSPLREQRVLQLCWKLKKLPSEVLAEDGYWVERLLADWDAREEAAEK